MGAPEEGGNFKDYITCVNTREVDSTMLTELNSLILAKKDLSKAGRGARGAGRGGGM